MHTSRLPFRKGNVLMQVHPSDSVSRSLFGRLDLLVVAAACFIMLCCARQRAESWNDSSRLATVEALVDHHTLAIDDSIFVHIPEHGPVPFPTDNTVLMDHGTLDKLYINGRFYSDKSPAPALWLAGVYQLLQWTIGLQASLQPALFCYLMTLVGSGLAYVVAVWSIYRIGLRVGLSRGWSLLLTGSFALSTVALAYATSTNGHIMMLGATAPLFWALLALGDRLTGRDEPRNEQLLSTMGLLGVAGLLTGLAYTCDLGVGPVLVLCVFALVGYRTRSLRAVAVFGLAALPFALLHHALNYQIGGGFMPANSNPAFFQFPNSPFGPENMTGNLKHTLWSFVSYATKMLLSKRGFLNHNLPLLLLFPALYGLWRKRPACMPEIVCALAFCIGGWLLYALASNNSSGMCCSIRWFVPFLGPLYFVLAVHLRDHAEQRGDFLILTGWGLGLSAVMLWHGPWITRLVPGYLVFLFGALAMWFAQRRRRHGQETIENATRRETPSHAA